MSETIKKKRILWTEGDIAVLLELWADRHVDLRRARRNAHIFNEIAQKFDGKFTGLEVHTKVSNLTQKYRAELKLMGPSGGSPSNWKLFNQVHQIIGSSAYNSATPEESIDFEIVQEITESPGVTSSFYSSSPSPNSPSEFMPSAPLDNPLFPNSPNVTESAEFSSACLPCKESSSAKKKKKNYNHEIAEALKENTEVMKGALKQSEIVTNEILKTLREQNQTEKDFLNIFKEFCKK